MKRTQVLTFGKINAVTRLVFTSLICIISLQSIGQTKDVNALYSQAEEQFNAKNYDAALSKLTLYENMSAASKEKAQILKVQIYREIALKDNSKVGDYNNSVEVIKKMYADGKKISSEEMFRILKEQQDFTKDAANQKKEEANQTSSEFSIDGIKIGMNIEEIPASVASNFDWSQGTRNESNEHFNYVLLSFFPKTMGTGNVFTFKMAGIQNITADDRTRRVIDVYKCIESDKYKEKAKSGLAKYESLIDELKKKYGESNVIVNPKVENSTKVMGMTMRTESNSVVVKTKAVLYSLSYVITNDTYSIVESMKIADYYKQ